MKINFRNSNKTNIYIILTFVYFIGGIITIISSNLFRLNKSHIGIAFLTGTLLVLMLTSTSKDQFLTIKNENKYFKITIILYNFLYAYSFIVFYQNIQYCTRTVCYFILLTLMCIIIFFQILSFRNLKRKFVIIILLEIFFVSINVFSTSFFLFPNLQGNDAIFHEQFIKKLIVYGNLDGTSNIYYYFPIFHITLLTITELIGINIRNSFFVLSMVETILSIFVYLIASKVFEARIGLAAFLLYSMSDYFISARVQVIPCFFAITSIIVLLYLFIVKRKSPQNMFIFLLMFFLLTFSHPLSTFIFISLCVIYLFISKEKEKYITTISTTMVLIIITISKWIYSFGTETDFFGNVIISSKKAVSNIDMEANVGQTTFAPNIDWISVALADMGYSLLITLALVGCLLSIQNKKFVKEDFFRYSLLVLFVIPIPYILALSFPSSIPARWFIVLEVLLSIAGGAGLFAINNNINKSRFKLIPYIILGILIFFMITSPVANSDSPLYSKEVASRSGLLYSELSSTKFVNSYLCTSFSANSKFLNIINENQKKSQIVNGNQTQSSYMLNPNDPMSYDHGLLVIRNYDMNKGFTIPYFGSQNKLLEVIPPNYQFITHIRDINKIYDNDNVKMYLN